MILVYCVIAFAVFLTVIPEAETARIIPDEEMYDRLQQYNHDEEDTEEDIDDVDIDAIPEGA